jgi:hypothetical protein
LRRTHLNCQNNGKRHQLARKPLHTIHLIEFWPQEELKR